METGYLLNKSARCAHRRFGASTTVHRYEDVTLTEFYAEFNVWCMDCGKKFFVPWQDLQFGQFTGMRIWPSPPEEPRVDPN